MFKIFVGNVNFKTTEEQIRQLFDGLLQLEDVVIARDPATSRSMGYGFVMTKDRENGMAAIRAIGKVPIDGRRVYLKASHGRTAHRRSAPPAPPRGPRTLSRRFSPSAVQPTSTLRPNLAPPSAAPVAESPAPVMHSRGYVGLNTPESDQTT